MPDLHAVQELAVQLLWMLSRHAPTRRQIAQHNFVDSAVKMLQDASRLPAKATAALIHNCAVSDSLKVGCCNLLM